MTETRMACYADLRLSREVQLSLSGLMRKWCASSHEPEAGGGVWTACATRLRGFKV